MKKISGLVFLITLILSACSPTPEPEIFPVEVGDSCAGASDLLHFEGFYRSKRKTCGNFYCWTFVRFYDDCTYTSSPTFQDTPLKGFLNKDYLIENHKDTILGVYSIEGSTLIMKSVVNEHHGKINGETLDLKLYNPSTMKSFDRPYTFLSVEAIP